MGGGGALAYGLVIGPPATTSPGEEIRRIPRTGNSSAIIFFIRRIPNILLGFPFVSKLLYFLSFEMLVKCVFLFWDFQFLSFNFNRYLNSNISGLCIFINIYNECHSETIDVANPKSQVVISSSNLLNAIQTQLK